MATLRDVKVRTRSLLGDDRGQYATDAFLTPKINAAYELIVAKILQYSPPVCEKLQPILNIPAGTTTLATYQLGANPPLLGLMTPLWLQWKQAGQPETLYVDAVEKKNIPYVTPGNWLPGQAVYWEWRKQIVYISPVSFAIDMMMRGEFQPTPLVNDKDSCEIHPLALNYLSFTTAAIAGGTKVNPTMVQTWTAAAKESEETIISFYVRKDQSLPIRIGKMTGGRRRGRFY